MSMLVANMFDADISKKTFRLSLPRCISLNILPSLMNMTRENIALALSIQNIKAKEIHERVTKVAKDLDIESVLKKYPYQTTKFI